MAPRAKVLRKKTGKCGAKEKKVDEKAKKKVKSAKTKDELSKDVDKKDKKNKKDESSKDANKKDKKDGSSRDKKDKKDKKSGGSSKDKNKDNNERGTGNVKQLAAEIDKKGKKDKKSGSSKVKKDKTDTKDKKDSKKDKNKGGILGKKITKDGQIVARAFWWGWQLEVPQKALDRIQGADDVAQQLLNGGLAIIGAVLPVVGVMAVLVASILSIHRLLINKVNKGKGVYLNWFWAQGYIAAALPLPTPIK